MVGNNGKISDIGFTSATKGKILSSRIIFSYFPHLVKMNKFTTKNIVNREILWEEPHLANTLSLRLKEF